jgi:hypothetical protein
MYGMMIRKLYFLLVNLRSLRKILHRYQVGAKETIDKLTYVPGNINFERAMKIIQGAQRDGLYT